MSRRLVVSVAPGERRAALIEHGEAVALAVERPGQESLAGGWFLARVTHLAPALPGAFVEIGRDRTAFLPGPVELAEGAALVVQVVKDGFEEKPPEVTAAPVLEGELAAWHPARPGRAVSRRLPPEARERLRALLERLIVPGEGVVLRSAAAAASDEAIAAEIVALRARHAGLLAAAQAARAPARLDPEPGTVGRLLAAWGPVEAILLDDRAAYAEARAALTRRQPNLVERLALDLGSGFEARHGLDEAFAAALAGRLDLPGGGHLTIESGVALTAIDVDLGAGAAARGRAAEVIRAANLEAAAAIGRHLRLRSIGGAVVVDFIGMRAAADRQAVEAALGRAVAGDPAGVALHGWTRLGHFELTRRRTVTPLADLMLGPAGQPRPRTATTVALAALRALAKAPFRPGPAAIRAHPQVVAALAGPLAAALAETARAIGRPVSLVPDAACDPQGFEAVQG